MSKKVELQVINITNSQAEAGAFAMLLGEVDGERKLPIIIGPAEAQATALFLKGIKTPRPLTHDLFTTTLSVLDVHLLRVLIYQAKEGVFYSYLYLKKDEQIIRMDARTSDAVAMAVRADCPIFIYDSILEQECIHISEGEIKLPKKAVKEEQKNESHDTEEEQKQSARLGPRSLEEELKQAIKNENYELAAKIRDRINSRNKNQ